MSCTYSTTGFRSFYTRDADKLPKLVKPKTMKRKTEELVQREMKIVFPRHFSFLPEEDLKRQNEGQ